MNESYLTVPYIDGGRDIAVGVDCWGMVRHVLHHEFAVPLLESFGGVNRTEPSLMNSGFLQASPDFKACSPKAGAVACCFVRGVQTDVFVHVFVHVGVCLNAVDVLHTSSAKGPHISSVRAFKRMHYAVKFYEYVGNK